MTLRKRETPENRKEQILNAGIKTAVKRGYRHITRKEVAMDIGVSLSLVTKYFSSMAQFKRAVLKAAIERENLAIIAQGLSLHDPLTRNVSASVKRKIKTLFD